MSQSLSRSSEAASSLINLSLDLFFFLDFLDFLAFLSFLDFLGEEGPSGEDEASVCFRFFCFSMDIFDTILKRE